MLKEINSQTVFKKIYSSETTKEGVALIGPKNYELGLIIGSGLKIGRYSLEARYEWGNGMSDFVDIGARTNRIYILLGIRL